MNFTGNKELILNKLLFANKRFKKYINSLRNEQYFETKFFFIAGELKLHSTIFLKKKILYL